MRVASQGMESVAELVRASRSRSHSRDGTHLIAGRWTEPLLLAHEFDPARFRCRARRRRALEPSLGNGLKRKTTAASTTVNNANVPSTSG